MGVGEQEWIILRFMRCGIFQSCCFMNSEHYFTVNNDRKNLMIWIFIHEFSRADGIFSVESKSLCVRIVPSHFFCCYPNNKLYLTGQDWPLSLTLCLTIYRDNCQKQSREKATVSPFVSLAYLEASFCLIFLVRALYLISFLVKGYKPPPSWAQDQTSINPITISTARQEYRRGEESR